MTLWPRAKRAGLPGPAPGSAGSRPRPAVTDPPENGQANRAVCAALAQTLGDAPSAVELAKGAAARETLILIAGDPKALALDPEALA